MKAVICKRFAAALPYAKTAAIILIYFTFIESGLVATGALI